MPKSHRPYAPEFRQRLIELVRKGRTPEELARQFEPSAQAIRNWVRQADRDAAPSRDPPTLLEDRCASAKPARSQNLSAALPTVE